MSADRLETFKQYLKDHDYVALVKVEEDYLEERKGEPHRWHSVARVVRPIKGHWFVGSTLKYYALLDSIPKNTVGQSGNMKFIFLQEWLPEGFSAEFWLDTGCSWTYEKELDELALKYYPPEGGHDHARKHACESGFD